MKIMFVCHGNICRSPMAEYITVELIKRNNIQGCIVKSSAVSSEEIWGGRGNDVDYRARGVLERHKIPVWSREATLIKKSDYNEYDVILCMDRNNIRWLERILGEDKDKKIYLLFDNYQKEKNRDVEDPWYSGNFEKVYDEIYMCCDALVNKIKGKN